jgi:diketogulonate reductase-like aldo/keto reductase
MDYIAVHGERIPVLGLGTYRLRGKECRRSVEMALEQGYRHIDTAEMYNNHSAVGAASGSSPVDRDEIFVTTKVWRTNLAYGDVMQAVESSLRDLNLDFVDLLLIHWPSDAVPVEETLEAMNRARKEGKTRYLGVSNFDVHQLKEAMDVSAAPLFTNQVRFHPGMQRDDLLSFCREHGLFITAYSPLSKGRVVTDDRLVNIGRRYGKSPAQVALRWVVQHEGVTAIPKANSRQHLEANLDIFDFKLTAAEMNELASG